MLVPIPIIIMGKSTSFKRSNIIWASYKEYKIWLLRILFDRQQGKHTWCTNSDIVTAILLSHISDWGTMRNTSFALLYSMIKSELHTLSFHNLKGWKVWKKETSNIKNFHHLKMEVNFIENVNNIFFHTSTVSWIFRPILQLSRKSRVVSKSALTHSVAWLWCGIFSAWAKLNTIIGLNTHHHHHTNFLTRPRLSRSSKLGIQP